MESVSTSRPAPVRMPKRLLGLRSDEYLAARASAGDDVAFEMLCSLERRDAAPLRVAPRDGS